MGKGGGKGRSKGGGSVGGGEIFVCDYCNEFEGNYAVVASHEKACKRLFDQLCQRAGTYDDGRQANTRSTIGDAEREEAALPTAKEKRAAAKKQQREVMGLETAEERLDDFERAHLERSKRGREERPDAASAAPATGPSAAAAQSTCDASPSGDAPSLDGPLSKAQRRKSAKRKRKEAASGAAADGATDAAVDRAPFAKPVKVAKVGGAVADAKPAKMASAKTAARESVLRKGVRILDLAAGSGPVVQDRARVKVKYVGRLESSSGDVFDRGTIAFRLGKGEVILGWDVGIQGMRVGSKRRITVPPAAGYGKTAAGKIPPNSTLCFDVAVLP